MAPRLLRLFVRGRCQWRVVPSVVGRKSKAKQERGRAKRDMPDLVERFWEQIRFIERSGEAYDQGDESEARRIAGAVRMLVHDTQFSKSVFGQLALVSKVRMLNTAPAVNPRNLLTTSGLASIRVSAAGAIYVPLLHDRVAVSPQLLTLNAWLTSSVGAANGAEWSRQDLILWVANTDGGSHVDPGLDPLYHELSRENKLKWFWSSAEGNSPVSSSYPLAAIRQIGYEVTMTARRLGDEGRVGQPPSK